MTAATPHTTDAGADSRPATSAAAAAAAARVPPGAPGPAVPAAAAAAAPGPRRLSVVHETTYHYDTPVEVAHHSAWLRPRDTELQQVQDWTLTINPEPEAPVQQSRDAFGNWRHGFSHARVHDTLVVTSQFSVRLVPPQAGLTADNSDSPPWPEVVQALRYRARVQQPDAVEFVLGSHFAQHHAELAAFADSCLSDEPGRPLLAAAHALMAKVHGHMAYKPNSTDVATNALQALRQAKGVCQDFAHLMIGALRSHGLAARYVSGYLLTQPPPGQPRLVGADASHAWVAVWCPLHGWVALDPTNNIPVGQDHVTLAWGRDYADVAPLRGVIRGGGSAPPEVAVTVAPID
jgi:transglutaminase-like putative cysteine protease